MPVTLLEKLKRKEVEVRAGGFLYRGVLVEVTEKEILLRSLTGFVSIPMDRVLSVVDPKAGPARAERKYVDPSFYTADISQPQREPGTGDDKK